MSKSRVKSMLIIFFDSKGIVHKEFVPPGQTVNQTFYLQVLECLRNRAVRVCREIANVWFLQHNNAPSHTSFAVREFLAQHNITTLPHPPYSPDLALCNFFFIPQAQNPPQRTSFWDSWNHPGSCDEGFEQHIRWRLSALLWRVAAILESLYSITRSLFWRG